MKRMALAPAALLAIFEACSPPPAAQRPPAPAARIRFSDVTDTAGIQFIHRHGGTGMKYLIETMGAGVCVLDYDGDSWPDLYQVQSAPLPGAPPDPLLRSALFRNNRDGTFTDVTQAAGVGNAGRYGQGCAVGDVDNDGDSDLYVTNFGPNSFFRNNGDGTFTETGRKAGVDDPLWGTSAAFADYDGDGFLDLFVANYLDFTLAKHKRCGDVARKLISYCHPDAYDGVPSVLYRNNRDGTFTDATREAGLWTTEGKGLGVVWLDYDQDGDPDLYVANDSVRNFLYQNNGDGTFTDVTLISGTGYSEEGRPEAGMGTASADADGDGRMDLFVTNLSNEVNELYRNNGDGTFTVATNQAGLGEVSLLFLAFGTEFLDADNDTDQDLYVTNGHVMDDIEAYSDSISTRERDFLFENMGEGRFLERGLQAGPFFRVQDVGRGMATLDYDRDGRLDVALSRCGGRARLLHNDTLPLNHFLSLRLMGTRSNRDGTGARVEVTVGGRLVAVERHGGSSYESASEGTVHLGLGGHAGPVTVLVRWPSGLRESFPGLGPDQFLTLEEGTGSPASP